MIHSFKKPLQGWNKHQLIPILLLKDKVPIKAGNLIWYHAEYLKNIFSNI